jgi:hypothetical protein
LTQVFPCVTPDGETFSFLRSQVSKAEFGCQLSDEAASLIIRAYRDFAAISSEVWRGCNTFEAWIEPGWGATHIIDLAEWMSWGSTPLANVIRGP